jgi:outer membrane receptor protein involved in Fe transport
VDAELVITDIGLYADLNVTLPADLRLRAGLRADALAFDIEDRLASGGQLGQRDAFGFHLGPKATLEWRPLSRLRVFASYGNGFRSPQALSLGQGESAPFTTVHAGELGGRLRLGRWLDATLAGFVTHVAKDLIFDHASGRTVATGGTTRAGATVMLESQPLSWLHATLGATYVRAVLDESGEVLPYVPPLVSRLDLDGRRGLARLWGRRLILFGDLAISVVGPRPLPYGERSRTVVMLDLSVGLELSLVTLSVELFNLADVRWRDGEFVYASSFDRQGPPSLIPTRHFTAGRPFTAQATLSLAF